MPPVFEFQYKYGDRTIGPLLHMRKIEQKIIFVAGLHGNERMPIKALKENGIPFILGNLRAAKKRTRFIKSDLNASFGLKGDSYEIKRAKKILEKINDKDLVVDFHTTSAPTPPFAIVVDKKMIPFAARTGLKYAVFMKHNIKKRHALINYRDGISVEAGTHDSKKSYNITLRTVKNILAGRKQSINIYEVFGKIVKPGRYVNFRKHSEGFIPILAGEKAYDFYGLKARRILLNS